MSSVNRKAYLLADKEGEFFTGFSGEYEECFSVKLGDAQLYSTLGVAQHFKGLVASEMNEAVRVREVVLGTVCNV